MNKENLDKLINHLQRVKDAGNEKAFNMHTWYEEWDADENDFEITPQNPKDMIDQMEKGPFECKTIACIAGHAALLSVFEGNEMEGKDIEDHAMNWLDLPCCQARELFIPALLLDDGMGKITIDQAIETLKRLKETGYVQWPKRS